MRAFITILFVFIAIFLATPVIYSITGSAVLAFLFVVGCFFYLFHSNSAGKEPTEEERKAARKEFMRKQLDDIEKKNASERAKKEQEAEAERVRKEQDALKEKIRAEEERVKRTINSLTKSLPFFLSNQSPVGEDGFADKKRWDDILDAIKKQDKNEITLYFVEILNLLDDQTYTKVGVTTGAVEERFSKSTQVELKNILACASLPRFQALFCEYHFIREFQITEAIMQHSDMSSPKLKFSGHTEVVRPNSTAKIIGFVEQLKPLTID